MPERKCALYVRVSTVKQAMVEEGSLDTQLALLRKHVDYEAVRHPDDPWIIAAEYREEGASAKNLERPAFKRLMADIEDGKIDVILVTKLDRISRSIRDFYDLIELFNKHSVKFVSLREQFDTTTAIGEFQMNLHLSIAQLERKQTGERTAATMAYRAQKGLPNGGRLLGYKSNKGKWEIDPEQAEIVRMMFEKCVDLGSGGAVHRHMAKMGIKRPEYVSRRGNKGGGAPYNIPAVLRMLRNVKFTGRIKYNGEIYEGQHDAIIDDELFGQVQAILDRNHELPNVTRVAKTHIFLLQGLLRCGNCGSLMTPRWSTGKMGDRYFYYECVGRAKSQREMCAVRYVPAEAAEQFVLDRLKEAVVDEDEINRIIQRANALRSKTLKDIEKKVKAVRKSLREVDEKIQKVLVAVEKGEGFDSLKNHLAELEGHKKELQDDLDTLLMKKDKTEQAILSADVVTREYASVPKIVDELILSRGWQRLKRLLQQHIEVIEWTEDEKDSKTGTMKIMLFEHAKPVVGHKIENSSASHEKVALEHNSWRPQRDLNPRRRRERPVSLPLDDGVA